jgi:hypothetical protein
MSEIDLDHEIHDLVDAARELVAAWNDPDRRRQIEAERKQILAAIDAVRRLISEPEATR